MNGVIYLKRCPFCGATAKLGRKGRLYEIWAHHSDECILVGYKPPMGFDRDALARRWDKRAEGRDDNTEE